MHGERTELPEYLRHDKLIPHLIKNLLELRENNQIMLVTLRKSKEFLYNQLRKFRLDALFDRVLVESESSNDKQPSRIKARMIGEEEHFKVQSSVIAGDTETDILAGKFLGIGTVAVLSGVRSKDRLLLSGPDYIIDTVSSLPALLNTSADKLASSASKAFGWSDTGWEKQDG